jgi:thiol-disulfide isomerase/thioredoxin
VKELRSESDPAKSTSLMKKIIKDNKLTQQKDGETIDLMKGEVAVDYLNLGKYADFEKCIATMGNKFNQTSYLSMAATTLVQKNKDLDVAEKWAKKTLDLYNSYKDDPKARPAAISEADWKRFMNFAYYPYCDTYATVLHAQGKNKEALEYQEKAFNDGPENGMPSSIERYAKLLALNNQEDKAYSLLLQMAKTGKSTSGMNDLLKDLYTKKNNSATSFDEFFNGLQQNVVVSLKDELKKKMQDVEAPGFTLKDIDGKDVSLADFKGKTVVLDFWATWCMPCRASFPAMQKVMKQHPEVAFLFIATQEKQEGALNRVKNYISQNKYPFHVLMDEPSESNAQVFKALSAYKPEGIPAKVIIDPKGRQRFLTIGFSSDTQLINEMEAMIQLINDLG